MDTRQALIKHLAIDLLHEHGLAQLGWTFTWDSAKRRAGACHYQTRTISASRYILPVASDDDVRETLLHEIAHALTPDHHHDNVWRAKLVEIGGTGARTHNMETIKGRYDLVCENCGVIGNRHQRQGSWKRASRENRVYSHNPCRGGAVWLQDRMEAPAPLQVPVAASEAQETPSAGPVCAHGCGQTTKGGKYLPGHDAKHVANLSADIACGAITPAQAFPELASSPALHNKLVARLRKMGWVYDADTTTWTRA